jgi:hypothetical protein
MKPIGPPKSGVKNTCQMHTAFHNCVGECKAICRRTKIVPNTAVHRYRRIRYYFGTSVPLLKFGTCAAKLYVSTPIVTCFFVILRHSSKQMTG